MSVPAHRRPGRSSSSCSSGTTCSSRWCTSGPDARQNLPLTVVLANLTTSLGGGWQYLTAAAFISMVAAAHRVLRPPALLRPRHHRRRREGLNPSDALTGRRRLLLAAVSAPNRSSAPVGRGVDLVGELGLTGRAPSTTAGGALAMKDSLARRARAASSQPSRPRRARARVVPARDRPSRSVGRPRPDDRLDLAARDDDRQVAGRARPRGAPRRVSSRGAAGLGRDARCAGRSASKAGPSSTGTSTRVSASRPPAIRPSPGRCGSR